MKIACEYRLGLLVRDGKLCLDLQGDWEWSGIDPLENVVKRKVGVEVHGKLNSQEGTNK